MEKWKLCVFLSDDTKFTEEFTSYEMAVHYLYHNKNDAAEVIAVKIIKISPDREEKISLG